MDVHSHKCRKCERVWTHERLLGGTDKEYEKAHTCTCGKIEYYVYDEMYRFLTEVLGLPEPPDSESRLTEEDYVDV